MYRFYDRTRYRTNYGYSDGRVINRGVDIDLVRRRSGQNIRERMVERVNDPGLLRNQNGRNSDHVRSYYVERDRLSRENVDGRKIERSDRRSSLDISRMGIDSRNDGSIERRRDTQGEIILNNREAQLYRRQMYEEKVRSNSRERELRKERNNNSENNRERSFERKRNENPVFKQERKTQKPEFNRNQRQVDRNRDNRQNNRSRSSDRDRGKRGR